MKEIVEVIAKSLVDHPESVQVTEKQDGDQLLLDKGYFDDVRVLGKTIPCIAPGGTEQIRDLLGQDRKN